MRPLSLEVKGFTAFREPQRLDFTDLDVFAIAGPTGSGKSSLLDAMTYALYGRVERVGDRVSQLISQGQPRMAVTLEFAVDQDRYRVTRSTQAKGGTKILLERQNGTGEWNQAGDGADRVRDAEQRIVRIIGLTYDGFTRSVLLPQGRFAEFLVGDPKKRRDILVELLGLSLFRRMAERSGMVAKESSLRAQTMRDMLVGEYGEVSADALKEARRSVKEAKKREKLFGVAAEKVLAILGRWRDAERSDEELRGFLDEVVQAATTVRDIKDDLSALSDRLEEASVEVRKRRTAATTARKALERAEQALGQVEAKATSRSEMTKAQGHAHAMATALEAKTGKSAQLAAAREAAAGFREALRRAERTLKERSKVLTALEIEVEEAHDALDQARHVDLVAAVSTGLHVGDPCPVCGTTLGSAPKRATHDTLRTATRALDRAKSAVDTALTAARQAERARDAADAKLQATLAEQERLTAEVRDLDTRIASGERALRLVFGKALPADPVKAIEERVDELHRLDRGQQEAAAEAAAATEALLRAEQGHDRVNGQVDRLRDRLVADRAGLFTRASRTLSEPKGTWQSPSAPSSANAAKLQGYAATLAATLDEIAARLESESGQRSGLEQQLLDQANRAVNDLIAPAQDLKSLAAAANAECRDATATVAAESQRCADLTQRLERKEQLSKDVRVLERRAGVFKALANELRADRLIAFLQAEALQILAAAGSDRLGALSEGRYRLVFRDDEFFVVDTWNGEDERSVKTLSGGETFLASLALALAVAEQVRSLSVTDRARLDSLFLDEGFGTLDQETLRTVVGAIELLAGDGRVIGVITHVPELAEQFPRIDVQKSPRGSSLRVAAA